MSTVLGSTVHSNLEARKVLIQGILQLIQALLITLLEIISRVQCERIPYHTSALSGYQWVLELLTGHPERIRTELGVHKDVFWKLITDLRSLGITDSKHVTLEEQLAIFLYMCVTGLTTQHVGEHFQRSNDTVSR